MEVVDVAGQVADEFVETLAGGERFLGVAEVPLAEQAGGVPAGFQHFGQQQGIGREAPVALVDVDHAVDAVALLVLAGKESAAGRAADGRIRVGLGEVDPFGRQPVDVRGAYVVCPAETKVGAAQVIREKDYDIWRPLRLCGQQERRAGEGCKGVPAIHRGYCIRVEAAWQGADC